MYKMPSLTGWTCPKCGNVYSPHTMICTVCNQTIKTTNASGGIRDDIKRTQDELVRREMMRKQEPGGFLPDVQHHGVARRIRRERSLYPSRYDLALRQNARMVR